ncbi:extracellular solute-binding protein [Lacibacterium aquatile]|uniref:Extracellular solute-binding protein n=1 Tax=Lacibacterium aquatile TaxID=1168082 RepID=A0ABW5DNX4_9PROT
MIPFRDLGLVAPLFAGLTLFATSVQAIGPQQMAQNTPAPTAPLVQGQTPPAPPAPVEQPSTPVEPPRESLTLFTAFDSQRMAQVFQEFSDNQKINVRIESDEADLILGRLLREGATSSADVIMVPTLSRLERATTAGLLQAMPIPELEKAIPAAYRDAQNRWFGIAMSARAVAFWNDRLKPGEVNSLRDLGKASLKGKVCLPPFDRLSNRTFIASLLQGAEAPAIEGMLKAIVSNAAPLPEDLPRTSIDGDDRVLLVAMTKGVCDAALIGSRSLARLADKGDDAIKAALDKVTIVWPQIEGRGTPIDVIGVGTTASSNKKEAVAKLLAYLASDSGQRKMAEALWAYPIKAGVPLSNPVTRWGPVKADPTPFATLQPLLPAAGQLGEQLSVR